MTDQPSLYVPSIANALLVSADKATIAMLTDCLDQLAISTEVSFDQTSAALLLNRKKFEAVIIDRREMNFLDNVRSSPSNRSAITFVISERAERARAFQGRPNFVLEAPLSLEVVTKTLKVSFGLIVRERRRYFRCPIVVPATLDSEEAGHVCCQIIDVSEGGIALSSPTKLRPGLVVDLQFELPGQISQVVKSEVCWHDATGRTGIRFLSQTPSQKIELQRWLAGQLEGGFPERVLNKYRATGISVAEPCVL